MSNEASPAPAPEAATREKSRRRFVRGVGVLVPVILTVSARSTLASTCLSPSAATSVNHLKSRHGDPAAVVCAGRSPGYWTTHESETTKGKLSKATPLQGTLFSAVFGSDSDFNGMSMYDVVVLRGGGNRRHEDLARHLVAAWFNFTQGLVPSQILNEEDLRQMWVEGRGNNYQPIAGIWWGPSRIVEYLKTTMI